MEPKVIPTSAIPKARPKPWLVLTGPIAENTMK